MAVQPTILDDEAAGLQIAGVLLRMGLARRRDESVVPPPVPRLASDPGVAGIAQQHQRDGGGVMSVGALVLVRQKRVERERQARGHVVPSLKPVRGEDNRESCRANIARAGADDGQLPLDLRGGIMHG